MNRVSCGHSTHQDHTPDPVRTARLKELASMLRRPSHMVHPKHRAGKGRRPPGGEAPGDEVELARQALAPGTAISVSKQGRKLCSMLHCNLFHPDICHQLI